MQTKKGISWKKIAMLFGGAVAAVGLVVGATVMPVSADAQSQQALADGDILVKVTPVPGADFPRARVTGVVEAAPAVVWQLVSDCERSQDLMPNVEKSFVVRREGANVVCSERIDLPFPLKDLVSVTKWRFVDEGSKQTRRWTLVEGDFDYSTGSIEVSPFRGDPTRTLVVYENHFAPQIAVPDWLSSYFQRQGLESIIEHVRDAAAELTARGRAAR